MKSLLLNLGILGLAVLSAITFVVNQPTNKVLPNVSVPLETIPTQSLKSLTLDSQEKTKSIKNLTLKSDDTVLLFGEIGEGASETAKQITAAAKKSKQVWLVINSPGGSVIDGAQIISAMQASPVPVNTVCLELCASMAAIIHQYGTHRYSVDRSILMFHPASGALQGTLEQMNSRLSTISRYVNKMNSYIAKRAKIPYDTFKQTIVSEYWIDAEDALDLHYTDGIVSLDQEQTKGLMPLIGNKNGKQADPVKSRINLDWK